MFWLGCSAIALAALLGLVLKIRSDGRRLEQCDQMKGALDDIQAANLVRDRLLHDAGYAERVRRRFTR